jgi:type III pantothenate kinase
MVDGLIERIAEETGTRPFVFATGGLAQLVAPHSRKIRSVDPNLTLDGLKLIFERSLS